MKQNLAFALSFAVLFASTAGAAFANETSTAVQPTKITDIALHDGGILLGQIVDEQRQPIKGQRVVVRFQNKQVAFATTDAQGRFLIRGLRAGTHSIATTSSEGLVQLWSPNTAPPAAHSAALLVTSNEPVVRAQGKGKSGGFLGNTSTLTKLVVLGAGAAGLAVALDNNPGS